MTSSQIIKIIIPLLILELALKGISLYSVFRGKTKYFPKKVWVLIILFASTFGPIGYLIFGRGEEDYDD